MIKFDHEKDLLYDMKIERNNKDLQKQAKLRKKASSVSTFMDVKEIVCELVVIEEKILELVPKTLEL